MQNDLQLVRKEGRIESRFSMICPFQVRAVNFEKGAQNLFKKRPPRAIKGIGSAHDDPEIPLNLSTNMNFNSHFLFDAPQKIPSLNNAK